MAVNPYQIINWFKLALTQVNWGMFIRLGILLLVSVFANGCNFSTSEEEQLFSNCRLISADANNTINLAECAITDSDSGLNYDAVIINYKINGIDKLIHKYRHLKNNEIVLANSVNVDGLQLILSFSDQYDAPVKTFAEKDSSGKYSAQSLIVVQDLLLPYNLPAVLDSRICIPKSRISLWPGNHKLRVHWILQPFMYSKINQPDRLESTKLVLPEKLMSSTLEFKLSQPVIEAYTLNFKGLSLDNSKFTAANSDFKTIFGSGYPDIYWKLVFADQSVAQVTAIKNSISWQGNYQTDLLHVTPNDKLEFLVYDKDQFSKDDLLAACTLQPSALKPNQLNEITIGNKIKSISVLVK